MKLKEYIQKVGEQELADKMNVSKNTIISWRYGARQPSVKQAKKLISHDRTCFRLGRYLWSSKFTKRSCRSE